MEVRTLNIPLPEDIQKLKWNGQYALVKEIIDYRVQKDIPSELKERLLLERELIDLVSREYIYTKDEVMDIFKKNFKDFTESDFDELMKDGALEFLFIEGNMMFKNDVLDNVLKTRNKYAQRSMEPISTKRAEMLDRVITKMIEKGESSYKIHMKLSLKIKEEYQRVGKMIRVWLPIPIEYEQVEDFKLIKMNPQGIMNDNNVKQRSVYFEVPYEKDMEFSVEYEFVNHSKYHVVDAEQVEEIQPTFYLDETPPHYVFTPYLQNLAKEIVQDETNPYLKAKKIYEWITSHVIYSFVRQYITLPNIPEYAATSMKGDCGILASLFITLCRIEGIPARWQAGLYTNPFDIGNHDWAQFYIAPYGWLFADCSFGGTAYRNGSVLRREFYFGNLEPFRMPSAKEFQGDLEPKNIYTRRDPYDHQTGEAEYFDMKIDDDGYEMTQEMIELLELNG